MCDDYWDLTDANVVCKQLGYTGASRATSMASYGQGNGTIWMDNVDCYSWNLRLGDCRFAGWGIHNCEHSEDAGVICGKIISRERKIFLSVIMLIVHNYKQTPRKGGRMHDIIIIVCIVVFIRYPPCLPFSCCFLINICFFLVDIRLVENFSLICRKKEELTCFLTATYVYNCGVCLIN